MFSRFVKVIWWLGLLAAMLGYIGYFAASFMRPDCSMILQLRAEVAKVKADADKRFWREQKGGTVSLNDLLGEDRRDPRDTEEFRLRAEACEYAGQSWVALVFGWALGLILWSLAYILGGRFWLPPNPRT